MSLRAPEFPCRFKKAYEAAPRQPGCVSRRPTASVARPDNQVGDTMTKQANDNSVLTIESNSIGYVAPQHRHGKPADLFT